MPPPIPGCLMARTRPVAMAAVVVNDLTIVNPNAAGSHGNDFFGHVLAVTNTHLVVGCYTDNASSLYGTVYVFDITDGTLLNTVRNPDNDTGSGDDYFGSVVGVNSTHFVVGAPREDAGGLTDSGEAYKYSLLGSSPDHTYTNPNTYNTPNNDQFGTAVAMSETYTLIGSPLEDSASGTATGSATLYRNSDDAKVRDLADPSPASVRKFGNMVALCDDYSLVARTNAAYLFDNSDGSLVQTFSPAYPSAMSVCTEYTLIGHRGADDPGGKAYLYSNSTGSLVHEFESPSAISGDDFGDGVSVTAAYSVIGCPDYYDASTSRYGAVFIFDNSTGALAATVLVPGDEASSGRFGRVAITPDGARLVVGAPEVDYPPSDSQSGEVYVYDFAALLAA